ncbi:hypothetical protein HMPREF3144_02405 [Oligella sp. HMSC05A10]|uniref:GNAT family N-acetyltransferase n=1 Tax=Oligella TaxID=90243 RepID=UPI0008A49089|nr:MULTISPECIES: GNAT family N-acetyltransferase [Oligella]OFS88327.1 hypothetical protein HMPREF3144_02405 [Oligella sp. HMSC05A10]
MTLHKYPLISISTEINSIELLCKYLMRCFEEKKEKKLQVMFPSGKEDLLADALMHGLIQKVDGDHFARLSMVWQHPFSGMCNNKITHYPYVHVVDKGIGHPMRPPTPKGFVYSRYIPKISKTIKFETLDINKHFQIFHDWMNQPRINKFWELAGDENQHRQYIQKIDNDTHTHAIIAYFDDEPFAYFEIYWAKEDRISAYYSSHDYDRGLHVLVGNINFLGKKFFEHWIISLMHYTYISETRCEKLVGEPRVDNSTFIKQLSNYGWSHLKEFDFPHKRAVFLLSERSYFFRFLEEKL